MSRMDLPLGRRAVCKSLLLMLGSAMMPNAGTVRKLQRSDRDVKVARDNCYMEVQKTTWIDDQLWEYRCEICCAGGVCETVGCQWEPAGATPA